MVKYLINSEEVSKDEFYKSLEEEVEIAYDEKVFDDSLDDICDPVKVLGYTFNASSVLKELDPTAYRCELADWRDQYLSESIDEVESKGSLTLDNVTFEISDEDIDEYDILEESGQSRFKSKSVCGKAPVKESKSLRNLKEAKSIDALIKEIEDEVNSLGESKKSCVKDSCKKLNESGDVKRSIREIENLINSISESKSCKDGDYCDSELDERYKLREARRARLRSRARHQAKSLNESENVESEIKDLKRLIDSL